MSSWDNDTPSVDDGAIVIRGSRRPDGTFRKDVKIRAGYVPQEEVPKFVSAGTAFETRKQNAPLPGMEGVPIQKKEEKLTQGQKKAAARRRKRAAKQEQKVQGGDFVAGKKKEEAEVPEKQSPPLQNKIKGVQKKIKQTEQLIEKKEAGQKLNSEQLAKIDRLDELQNELAALKIEMEEEEEEKE